MIRTSHRHISLTGVIMCAARASMKNDKKSFIPPCDECGGKCCNYVAVEVDRPTHKKDYDHIRWWLAHKDVNVFVDHDKKWHIEFRSPCENLTADKKCRIYHDRPHICRGHGNKEEECEYFDSPYLLYFSTANDFEQYLTGKGRDWRFIKGKK